MGVMIEDPRALFRSNPMCKKRLPKYVHLRRDRPEQSMKPPESRRNRKGKLTQETGRRDGELPTDATENFPPKRRGRSGALPDSRGGRRARGVGFLHPGQQRWHQNPRRSGLHPTRALSPLCHCVRQSLSSGWAIINPW